ncbi:endonuclease III [Candidatus Micrarchaeota archaeon]|nr:endonuclease III [Candidatus Micrarchaeota archaeon]MBU2476225.1 endonuclease III [Candidatus Micrarchaeota archaeon]
MKKKNILLILKLLKKEVGFHKPVVGFENPFKVLISTVLSQRTRDENTEKASKALFKKFSNSKTLAKAKTKEIESLIKPAGFYRVKAKTIKKIAIDLIERFNGKVPSSLEQLVSLKGVGRKTANCVLVYSFHIPAIPVDVHVHRISNRIGLVKTKTPEESETELMKVFPKSKWIELNDLMVKFGQNKCFPRNPKCETCLLNKECDFGREKLNKGKTI